MGKKNSKLKQEEVEKLMKNTYCKTFITLVCIFTIHTLEALLREILFIVLMPQLLKRKFANGKRLL
jgi:hypothetical protein